MVGVFCFILLTNLTAFISIIYHHSTINHSTKSNHSTYFYNKCIKKHYNLELINCYNCDISQS